MGDAKDLAKKYIKAGGDQAGAIIGIMWAFAYTPDASEDDYNKLRNLGVIGADEKIGELDIDGDGFWVKVVMENIADPIRASFKMDWKRYMEANPILTGKVGDVVIPIGSNLKKNDRKEISMEISMIIENGDGYSDYEFLHGTDEKVGNFQISGTISKNENGDINYDLNYKWNDIINPEVKRYIDDAERNAVAEEYFKPKDYTIRISWSDTTKIIANPWLLSNNSGWLKDRTSNWIEKLNLDYKLLFAKSNGEQTQIEYGGLGWAGRLAQIKEKYSDYYK